MSNVIGKSDLIRCHGKPIIWMVCGYLKVITVKVLPTPVAFTLVSTCLLLGLSYLLKSNTVKLRVDLSKNLHSSST